MSFERFLIYGLALVLVILALARRSHAVRARDIKGNMVVGNNRGSISQNYSETGAPATAPSPAAPAPDRVAWAIGIVGALIAAAQLAHDLYK